MKAYTSQEWTKELTRMWDEAFSNAHGEQMTQDDIIRMAEEARVHFENFGDRYIERLEKFAEIVAAAEREECAKLCEAYVAPGIGKEMATAIRARGSK